MIFRVVITNNRLLRPLLTLTYSLVRGIALYKRTTHAPENMRRGIAPLWARFGGVDVQSTKPVCLALIPRFGDVSTSPRGTYPRIIL